MDVQRKARIAAGRRNSCQTIKLRESGRRAIAHRMCGLRMGGKGRMPESRKDGIWRPWMGARKKCKTRGRMPIVLPTNQHCETGRFATKHRMRDGKWADRSEGLKGRKAGKPERQNAGSCCRTMDTGCAPANHVERSVSRQEKGMPGPGRPS